MRIRAKPIIIVLSVAILLALLPPLLGNPRLFRIDKDIDANTGDVRVQVYICSLQTKSEIEMTPFSQEVRRLSIPVLENRVWRRVGRKLLTRTYICPTYRSTIRQCNTLMEMFDYGHVSDEDRRVILQKILMALQSENGRELREIDAELNALAEEVYKTPTHKRL